MTGEEACSLICISGIPNCECRELCKDAFTRELDSIYDEVSSKIEGHSGAFFAASLFSTPCCEVSASLKLTFQFHPECPMTAPSVPFCVPSRALQAAKTTRGRAHQLLRFPRSNQPPSVPGAMQMQTCIWHGREQEKKLRSAPSTKQVAWRWLQAQLPTFQSPVSSGK